MQTASLLLTSREEGISFEKIRRDTDVPSASSWALPLAMIQKKITTPYFVWLLASKINTFNLKELLFITMNS